MPYLNAPSFDSPDEVRSFVSDSLSGYRLEVTQVAINAFIDAVEAVAEHKLSDKPSIHVSELAEPLLLRRLWYFSRSRFVSTPRQRARCLVYLLAVTGRSFEEIDRDGLFSTDYDAHQKMVSCMPAISMNMPRF